MAGYLPLPRIGRRGAALVGVGAAHVAVVACLLVVTRVSQQRPADSEPPLLWIPLPALPIKASPLSLRQASGPARASAPVLEESRPQDQRSEQSHPIDWHAEATSTAIHEVGRDEAEQRRIHALATPHSPMFDNRQKAPEFHWDYAATHRVEASEEGGYLIHLNDQCVLVIAMMFMPVCATEKPPARSDLFEHMRDPPRPASGRVVLDKPR